METILVVEDDEMTRSCVVEILREAGYAVLSAENGAVGLNLAKHLHIDLVVSDINMPQVDGLSLLSSLREGSSTKEIPFLFLTSESARSTVNASVKLGADNYLSKPFMPEDLLGAVAARFSHVDYKASSTTDDAPTFLNNPSCEWIYENFIVPRLLANYQGWFVAIEPDSGKCFLGATMNEAHAKAAMMCPGSLFFIRKIEPVSNLAS